MGPLAELRKRVDQFAEKFLSKTDFDRWLTTDYDYVKQRVNRQTSSAEAEVQKLLDELKTKGEALLSAKIEAMVASEIKPRIAELFREIVTPQDLIDWIDGRIDMSELAVEVAAIYAKDLKLDDIREDLVRSVSELFYDDLDNEVLEETIADKAVENLTVTFKSP